MRRPAPLLRPNRNTIGRNLTVASKQIFEPRIAGTAAANTHMR